MPILIMLCLGEWNLSALSEKTWRVFPSTILRPRLVSIHMNWPWITGGTWWVEPQFLVCLPVLSVCLHRIPSLSCTSEEVVQEDDWTQSTCFSLPSNDTLISQTGKAEPQTLLIIGRRDTLLLSKTRYPPFCWVWVCKLAWSLLFAALFLCMRAPERDGKELS